MVGKNTRPTFFGKPCKYGHDGERYLSTKSCYHCALKNAKAWHAENSDHVKARKRASASVIAIQQAEYHVANRDEICARKRAKYWCDPVAGRERTAAWRAEDPERTRASYRKWRRDAYARDPEKIKGQIRKWRTENPEIVKMMNRARKSRERSAEGFFRTKDVFTLFDLQRGQCAYFGYCGTIIDEEFHIDHIVPLAKGGTNWPQNLQLTCPTCNLRKHAKDPIAFLSELWEAA